MARKGIQVSWGMLEGQRKADRKGKGPEGLCTSRAWGPVSFPLHSSLLKLHLSAIYRDLASDNSDWYLLTPKLGTLLPSLCWVWLP